MTGHYSSMSLCMCSYSDSGLMYAYMGHAISYLGRVILYLGRRWKYILEVNTITYTTMDCTITCRTRPWFGSILQSAFMHCIGVIIYL